MSSNEDMQKFITCIQCRQIPKEPPLYSCKEGHIFCELCFLETAVGPRYSTTCPVCGNRINTRNIFSEELLKAYSSNLVAHSAKSLKKTKSRSTLRHTKSHLAERTESQFSLRLSTSIANTSRRPIYCPNTDCRRMIAVTQLVAHFQFDHSRIPMEGLEFNQPKTLVLSLNSMDYGKSHCIALLLIAPTREPFEYSSPQQFQDNGLAFPLLAAKLRCKPEAEKSSPEPEKPVASVANKPEGTDVPMNYSDVVIIWICGNVECDLKCLIEVSDEKQTRIYSYYGSVNSLREKNDPKSVFLRADCLLLHSSNVQRITHNGDFPMDLKVLINCPYEPAA